MRILIFHGYLLRGTGSNIYNASLAKALVDLGHEVHLVCQERDTRGLDFVDGERCTVHVPDIEGVLPLYVADEYEGFEAVPFPELDDARIERYVDLNVRAVAEVARAVEPDVALANHLVMGPVVLARALEGRVPYAVKIHGSALEYVVRPHRERFIGWAKEGLAGRLGRPGRLAPHRREPLGGPGRARACPSARGWGRRAWTSTTSARAPTRRRRRGCASWPARWRGPRPPAGAESPVRPRPCWR